MKTLTINCFHCQTPFEKFKGEYDRQIRNGNVKFFCSKECYRAHIKIVNGKKGIQLRKENETQYYLSPKLCPQCNSVIPYDFRESTYCSHKCGALYTQRDGRNYKWTYEDKQKISKSLKEFYKSNPNRKKEISERSKAYCRNNPKYKNKVFKICKSCGNSFETLYCCDKKGKQGRVCCSWKCYQDLIKRGYLKGKSGGYRERGGRGKQGWYKGYYCHSTWELAWVIYNLEHGIPFVRNAAGFDYALNGKMHKFYPDFILDDGQYVEIKGWDNGTVAAKLYHFPHKLMVLRGKEMEPYLQYSRGKYGKELHMLYEKSD